MPFQPAGSEFIGTQKNFVMKSWIQMLSHRREKQKKNIEKTTTLHYPFLYNSLELHIQLWFRLIAFEHAPSTRM